jgi:transposase/IS5 family transposase
MVMIPVSLENQLMPGTLEHTIHEVIENKVDLSIFNEKYKNDETGAPAHDPKILLKVVLLGFSRSMIGSRKIEKACQENITFMALSCGVAPDHSTIAHFISSMREEIIHIFCDVLLYCEELNLLGGSHFSLDGCKLPSNASKQWSGTFKDLKHKRNKLEEKVGKILLEHEKTDKDSGDTDRKKRENQIKRMNRQINRIDKFLKENNPKKGKTKEEIQSNVSDNDSAKMPTAHGVIQGYNAQALVDDKHQIIVHAEAMGNGQDHDNLSPMLDGAKKNMKAISKGDDYFKGKELSADANYHSSTNLQKCQEEQIDAYIPDNEFRKRDERYKNQKRFKDGVNRPPKKKAYNPKKEIFSWEEFEYDKDVGKYKCPNGKYLNQQSLNHKVRNKVYHYYRAREADCRECSLRSKCLARKNGKARALLIPLGYIEDKEKQFSLSQKMKEKIDSVEGKAIYSKRFAIIEPVFANIRSQKRLDRFTYRGKVKVNIQWMLYCMVHNIEKIMNYGLTG